MRVVSYDQNHKYNVPVTGAGSDINKGALLIRGGTPATNNGMAVIGGSLTNASADAIGILKELHDFSVTGDTNIGGTVFVTHEVAPIVPWRVVRILYDSSTVISATQAVNSTTMTITSLEDNIDAAFWYVTTGTGAGQTNYSTASASGSTTLKAAFTTDLDTTSRLIKILPRFHPLIGFDTSLRYLGSGAAAGGTTGMVLESFIERNNRMERLDPTAHDALTGLNSLQSIRFWADVAIRDSAVYTID